MLSEADYNDLLARANAGADAARKLAEKERDDEIEAAIAAGKFDPAQRDEFVRLYEESPDLMTRVISALPENEERAKIYGTEDEREFSEEDDAFYRRYLALAAIEPGEAA
jgi:hypothetical protein